jgi:predicted helicase
LENNLQSIKWNKLKPNTPDYFFVPRNVDLQKEYEKGFKINELFITGSNGMATARDNFTIHFTKEQVKETILKFLSLNDKDARIYFNLGDDVQDWSVSEARKDLTQKPDFDKIIPINYRPFDIRYTYFTGKSRGFHCMPRGKFMEHFIKGKNLGLIIGRQGQVVGNAEWNLLSVTSNVTDLNVYYRGGGLIFPLYLYQENFGKIQRATNMKEEIVKKITAKIGVGKINEIQIFDYIYAVLHSPSYRNRYKEFLKTDFPHIPYPENDKQFERLAGLGEKLRKLHLMENVKPQKETANFPVAGTNEIEKPQYSKNKVFINKNQYFDNVPLSVWNFYIGGYQPAQKWLKDRRNRTLNYEEIQHYQQIIAVLGETEQIMKEIDIKTI